MRNIFSKKYVKATLTIVCVFVLVSLSSNLFIKQTREDIGKQQEQFLGEIVKQNAVIIKRTLELNLNNMETIAHIIKNKDEFDIDYVVELLEAEAERSSFKRMGYADLDGNAITTDESVFSIGDREYFKTAIKGKNSVSERLVDKMAGGSINVYAVPLYYKEELKGVIFATNETSSFSDILETPLFGGKSYSYIITKEGVPVVYTKNQKDFKSNSNIFDEFESSSKISGATDGIKNSMAQGENGIIEYSKDNLNMVGVYCNVGINDWYVISIVPKSVISQNADKIILRNSITVALTTMLFIGLIIAMFVQNKKNRQKLEKIAYFDELIAMPNFNSFQDKAQKILEDNKDKRFCFAKLDIDNFKMINDRFGFAEGDLILQNVAKAISVIVGRNGGLFSRFAVDEFIIMLAEKSREEITVLSQEFLERFYEQEGLEVKRYIQFPTGYYSTNLGETSIKDIFEKVNYAHRQAKLLPAKIGVTEFFYDDFQKTIAIRESKLGDNMLSALKNKEFKVYLQPKYELKNETIVGAEALVRWQDENGEIISPMNFIPLFERNGFITQLDMYMFREVCLIIKGWMDSEMEVVTVSVNFSRQHLLDDDFIDKLVAIANKCEVPCKYIEIELTETAVFENIERLELVLKQMHDKGFTMSMDDFGTGYSSLGMLKTLDVDIIKMDRSFFVSSNNKHRTKTVVESVISMAQKLDIHTVAEGVEDLEHIELLREAGCEVVQGYYYSKPMPAEEFFGKLNKKQKAKNKN